jgi:hypothetical protein
VVPRIGSGPAALNRDVALKVIADGPAVSPARLVRFRSEAEGVLREAGLFPEVAPPPRAR